VGDDTTGGSRRDRGRRTVLAAVTAWLAVVGVVSTLAWFAIGSAGSEVLDPQARAVPSAALPTGGSPSGYPSPSPPPTTSPPPTAGVAPTGSAPTGSAPAGPAPVDQVYRVTGGQVGCRCTGQQVALNGAWPDEGWTVESSTSDGGARLRVEFESDDARTRVEATCVDGGPSVTVEDASGGGGDDD
jgi:hypothetical protein